MNNDNLNIEYSVIIPLFNEEGSLGELQQRLDKVMGSFPDEYEIIYIDDGSTDSSSEVLEKLKSEHPRINVISFNENKKKCKAVWAGLEVSRGRWIITIDADLQNPPEEIPKLLKFKDDFDFVGCIRKHRKDKFVKKAASLIARFFRFIVLGDTTKDAGCFLHLFKRETINGLSYFRNFYIYLPFLARIRGFSVKEIDMEHYPRKFGRSKYGILKRAWIGIFDLWYMSQLKKRLIKENAGKSQPK